MSNFKRARVTFEGLVFATDAGIGIPTAYLYTKEPVGQDYSGQVGTVKTADVTIEYLPETPFNDGDVVFDVKNGRSAWSRVNAQWFLGGHGSGFLRDKDVAGYLDSGTFVRLVREQVQP